MLMDIAVLNAHDPDNELLYEDNANDNSIPDIQKVTKKNNALPLWGNQKTMNLNGLVLENIIQCTYWKNFLTEYNTFQQLADEVYYNVKHLEPWEKGTRKTQGMTGMCGGVRGVGAGGIISSAFCLLYKMFTLKITRKQLVGMINSTTSPYLRGIGFMYIRFCQPPQDLWTWFEPYLDDDDTIDPRSGGGDSMTFGQVVRMMLTKLDWYGTLFPRIPVPIQKDIEQKFREYSQATIDEERERYRSREDRRRRSTSRDRDRKRPATGRERDEKRPKIKTRCAHHLRHHHCRKHRKECPKLAKAKRAAADAEKKAAEAEAAPAPSENVEMKEETKEEQME